MIYASNSKSIKVIKKHSLVFYCLTVMKKNPKKNKFKYNSLT